MEKGQAEGESLELVRDRRSQGPHCHGLLALV